MKKRFIVGVNNPTAQETAAITEMFKAAGNGWWHYIDGLWFTVDHHGTQNADQIRDAINRITVDKWVIVQEIAEGGFWSGFGPNAPNNSMFSWLWEQWKR